jgi:phenylalanyl-tRNA synthetase beta chain
LVARDYREAITYSFIDPAVHAIFSTEEPVKLANPLADNMAVMRTSLIPGLMGALQFNANRQHDRIRFYEVGASYHKDGKVFREEQKLSGVVMGQVAATQWGLSKPQNIDFYDVKSDLEAVLALTGHKNPIIFNEFEHIALHPGQSSLLTRKELNGDKTVLGWLGRLHPTVEKHYGVHNVVAFEINLGVALNAQLPSFQSVSRFPSIKRDLSVLVDQDLPIASLLESLQNELGTVLVKVELFDLYRGQGVADDAKSISLSLVLQHQDKTMTDEEAEGLVGEALSLLEAKWGATLRS